MHPVPSDPSVAVVPSPADTPDSRSVGRLRDALRHPYDDIEEDKKPYRLSVSERQRLREQLRDRYLYDTPKK